MTRRPAYDPRALLRVSPDTAPPHITRGARLAWLRLERLATMTLPPMIVSIGLFLLLHSLFGLRGDVAAFLAGMLFMLGTLMMAVSMAGSQYSQRVERAQRSGRYWDNE
jgi:ABC-type spermidine/putrescine transport system permease subunit II